MGLVLRNLLFVYFWICAFLLYGRCHCFLLSVSGMCDYLATLDCKHNTTGPICGKNGITYRDRCEFTKSYCKDPTISVHYLGPCLQQQEKQAVVLSVACQALLHMNCRSDSDSINYCASDGVTYRGTIEVISYTFMTDGDYTDILLIYFDIDLKSFFE